MNQKNQLNLASLHQRQEEISESEMMKVVGAVQTTCNCNDLEPSVQTNLVIEAGECSCGSIWVVFGLGWG